jgi:hypothetical protein
MVYNQNQRRIWYWFTDAAHQTKLERGVVYARSTKIATAPEIAARRKWRIIDLASGVILIEQLVRVFRRVLKEGREKKTRQRETR